MTRRAVCSGWDALGWEEYELPQVLKPQEIRVRNTQGAEKHGTKVAFIHGHGNRRGGWDKGKQIFVPGGVAWSWPIPLGDMNVGVVEEIGVEVRDYKVGDRVVYFGGLAPTAVIHARAGWKLRADTCWKAATCLDPATFAFCALRDGQVRVGDAVAVFGLGAIGLMAVQIAKLAGSYPVLAIDPLANRRAVAQQTGADLGIDPRGQDVGALLKEATHGRGVDVVLDYSGAMEAMQAALRGVAFGGSVVAGAFPGPMKAGLDLGAEAHLNRPNILFSRTESDPNRDHPRWDNVRVRAAVHRLILEGKIDGKPVVTPVLKFDDSLLEQYEQVTATPEKSIKLGVEY